MTKQATDAEIARNLQAARRFIEGVLGGAESWQAPATGPMLLGDRA